MLFDLLTFGTTIGPVFRHEGGRVGLCRHDIQLFKQAYAYDASSTFSCRALLLPSWYKAVLEQHHHCATSKL